AGLTVAEDAIPAAMARLSDLIARDLDARSGRGDLRISGLIEPSAATPDLMRMIEDAGPFGQAAPAPRFAFADQMIDSAGQMGHGHLRLSFRAPGGPVIDAVGWGAMNGPLGPALVGAKGRRFHLAGKLELSTWNGRARVRLRLDDAAPV
ncbi:MAG: single-stranded-DNA-specific exonuclease RecJ, partial [Paracoccus sp. (in: a-proteobacteria)]|nr:single-stranded-DNA-specific exonuclease RecJ [Paracoccus sp. (in: a-proteobacteria)]